ncbi:hypothetical protein AGR4C_pb30060 [Agrobacterium tumefaciens str. Kerr 14]|uniref:Uncharacterized protein n=1 Tax=Agrobacterium tumefaciens str. Kerr 14 TaxID=1183424 RepID=A0A1S7SFB1_AGRTU|nr:hypothetical protein AGR4C_pb30060 [Agrobacterium tumefaciens str. Kerr 14]
MLSRQALQNEALTGEAASEDE